MKIKIFGFFLSSLWLVSCEETTTVGPRFGDTSDDETMTAEILQVASDSEEISGPATTSLPDLVEAVTELIGQRKLPAAEARKLKDIILPVLTVAYYRPNSIEKTKETLFSTRNNPKGQENEVVLTAGVDFQRRGQLALDCVAPFPVQWQRDGIDVSLFLQYHAWNELKL